MLTIGLQKISQLHVADLRMELLTLVSEPLENDKSAEKLPESKVGTVVHDFRSSMTIRRTVK